MRYRLRVCYALGLYRNELRDNIQRLWAWVWLWGSIYDDVESLNEGLCYGVLSVGVLLYSGYLLKVLLA